MLIGHCVHAPPSELALPAAQATQLDTPVKPLVLVPAGQLMQLEPAVGEYVFAPHGMHCSNWKRAVRPLVE